MDIKEASEYLQSVREKLCTNVAIVINEIVLEFRAANSLSLWKYLYNDINRVYEIRGSNIYVTSNENCISYTDDDDRKMNNKENRVAKKNLTNLIENQS